MALGSLPCMQTLDVLAEWLSWRGITFSRMDGSTNPIQRELDVRDFNADGSPTKVFLISTRAGGVGINLASADVGEAQIRLQLPLRRVRGRRRRMLGHTRHTRDSRERAM